MKEKEQDYSRLQKAVMTPKDKLCIEIAALCHDLGVYNSFKLYHKDCTDAVKKWERQFTSSKEIVITREKMQLFFSLNFNQPLEIYKHQFTEIIRLN